eukprot:scaffold7359_cov255-Pinguiococcus_pyrenoidosus.AAC.25
MSSSPSSSSSPWTTSTSALSSSSISFTSTVGPAANPGGADDVVDEDMLVGLGVVPGPDVGVGATPTLLCSAMIAGSLAISALKKAERAVVTTLLTIQ